jgi:hypothetical protein
MIAKVATDALRLDQKKPLQTTHHFKQSYDAKDDQVRLDSSQYKNRIHRDKVSCLPIQHSFFLHSCFAASHNGDLWLRRDVLNFSCYGKCEREIG